MADGTHPAGCRYRRTIEAIGRRVGATQGVVSVAVCLLNSYRNPANEQTAWPPRCCAVAPEPLRDAILQLGIAADPGIPTGVHHGRERVHHADHRSPICDALGREPGGEIGDPQQATDHAQFRRRYRRRHRRAQSGADDRERTGGRARWRPAMVSPSCLQPRPAAVVRHGRHHGESVPDRAARAAGDRELRSRPQIPLPPKAAGCR